MKAAVLYEHKTPLKMEELNLKDPGFAAAEVEISETARRSPGGASGKRGLPFGLARREG